MPALQLQVGSGEVKVKQSKFGTPRGILFLFDHLDAWFIGVETIRASIVDSQPVEKKVDERDVGLRRQ